MSNPIIARAVDMARRAEHCRQTGQPRMAELYEKNLRQALREARAEVRAERIKTNPFRIFQFIGQDVVEAAGIIGKAWGAAAQESIKSDFTLAN